METGLIGLLLLPAVVGYLLLMRWRHTRQKTIRQSGYHLFFKSILAGSLLVAIATALLYPLVAPSVTLSAYRDILVLLAVSLGLALLLPLVWNRLPQSKRREADSTLQSAKARGDIIEALLEIALRRFMPVQLKLIGGNMYVGFVTHSGITSEEADTDVSIFLLYGGYWDKEMRKLVITEDSFENLPVVWREEGGDEGTALERSAKTRRHAAVVRFDYLRSREAGGDEQGVVAIPIRRIESARILRFDQLFDIFSSSISRDAPREGMIDNAA